MIIVGKFGHSSQYLGALGLFFMLVLVSSVSAAPSLSLNPQSSAQYELLATLRTLHICSTSPSNYSFVGCGGGPSFNPSNLVVNVTDDGLCSWSTDLKCSFGPANVTVKVGSTVEWHDIGTLNHTIAFRSGPIFGFSLVISGNLSRGFFSPYYYQTFDFPGNYSYYDTHFPWMKGNIDVTSLPVVSSLQEVNATGPIGWTVVGLDQRADLSFDHALTITSNSTGSTTTTSNESGTFEETIDLGSRDESPGLASGFQYLPPIFPVQWLNGIGYFPNSYYYYPPRDVYTIWWVNGPLVNGSTVQLLTSVASVRGSGSFQLGGQAFEAWTVSSNFVESYNQTGPGIQLPITPILGGPGIGPITGGSVLYPEYYTAGSSSSVSISLGYGKLSDLLFQASASLRNYNRQVTEYPQGSYIYPPGPYYYPIRLAQSVNVTNTSVSTISLSLKLTNTNLDLSKRMTPPPTTSGGGSNPTPGGGSRNPAAGQPTSTLAWEYLAGAVVATGAGVVVWLGIRPGRRSPSPAMPSGVPPITG